MLHQAEKQFPAYSLLAVLTLALAACSTHGLPATQPESAPQPTAVMPPHSIDVVQAAPSQNDVGTQSGASPTVTAPPRSPAAANRTPNREYTVHLPPDPESRQPLTVLVALHGMGGNGSDFSRKLIEHADRRGWLLVAPSIKYRDWRDPEEVRRDGAEYLPALKATLEELPRQTGLALRERVLLYGFSRGGQAAHRFAFMYPEASRGVAALSSGTYTLPKKQIQRGADEALLRFPYGVADLEQYIGKPFDPAAVRQVGFWLGVGANDNLASDLPRQWDAYIGSTRVERARAFSRALEEMGANAELAIFPNASHEVTDEMRAQAVAFLGGLPQ
jgi:predicted esterase